MIEYLTYFFEYLEDDIFFDLLAMIYGKEKFYNPCNSNKEFFLNILLNNLIPVQNNEVSYEDLVKDRNLYLDVISRSKSEESLEEELEEELMFNSYYQAKKELQNYIPCWDDEIEAMLELCNGNDIPFQDTEKVVLKYLEYIIRSIQSFNIILSPSENKKRFKIFLNEAVKKILKDKYCYIVYYSSISLILFGSIKNNKENIEESSFLLEENKDKGLYLCYEATKIKARLKEYTMLNDKKDSSQKHALIGVKSLESYLNSIKSIDEARKKLESNQRNCHICYPLFSNTKLKKSHKCDNCKRIYEIIKKIGGSHYNTKYINEIIKEGHAKESNLTFEQKRKAHYERVKKLFKHLAEHFEQNTNKYKTEINDYLDTAFGDLNIKK